MLRWILCSLMIFSLYACAANPKPSPNAPLDGVLEGTSCSSTGSRSCCCKDIGGNDCIKNTTGCDGDYPTPVLLP
jgi:hypothetical protein